MQIERLDIDHFGKFHQAAMELSPGINVIYGENESGKSTIHAFMQCMLFGAGRLRGRGSGKDTYSRYQPWDGGGSYEGRLTFTYQDKHYRIVRNFYKENMTFQVYEEETGRIVLKDEDSIASLIEGLTPGRYRNSISAGQLSMQPEAQFTTEMQTYLANLAMGADESVDVGSALNFLKEERKRVNAEVSDEVYLQLQNEVEQLQGSLGQKALLQERMGQLEEQRRQLKTKIETLESKVEAMEGQDRKDRMRAIQLIQENNDIASLYREKKEELQKLAQSTGNESSRRIIQEVIDDYEERQAQIDDHESDVNTLEDQMDGSTIKNLVFLLPLIVLTLVVFVAGSAFALQGMLRIVVGAVLGILTVIAAIYLFRMTAVRKKRVILLNGELVELHRDQQALMDRYQIQDIDELREKGMSNRSQQEAITRLKKEKEVLRERYDRLQEPLKPYLEKYGDSVTLDSDAAINEKRQIEKYQQQMSELVSQIEQMEWQIDQLNETEAALQTAEEKVQQVKQKKRQRDENLEALDISGKVIKDITAQIHGSFGSQLNAYVSDILSHITDAAHERLTIDEKFQVQVDDKRQMLQPQQLSAGTVDQIYFSVRMAVSQLLFQEPMPLILDDSFVLYDDKRLENVLSWLAGQQAFSQIIIFTCHHREAQILDKLGVDYHMVTL